MESVWKNIQKNSNIIMALAPLDGVTDFVFREIITKTAKPDIMFTEFTSTDGLCSAGREKTLQRLKYSEGQRPIIAQIWGTVPEKFKETASIIKDLGFDGVDINMGCPDKAVLKVGSGAAHCMNKALTSEIIHATKEGAGGLPVSIKTRLGLKEIVTEDWISFVLSHKPAALTIHGRTAKELSKVPAHWDEISKGVKLRDKLSPETIILGNGDVTSYADAVEKTNVFGVDGVMIGRGIFSNPWIFDSKNTQRDVSEYLKLLVTHTKLYEDVYGKGKKFDVMKKFFKVYVKEFSGAAKLKTQLMSTLCHDDVLNVISAWEAHTY